MKIEHLKYIITSLRKNASVKTERVDVKNYMNGYNDALNVVEHYIEQEYNKLWELENRLVLAIQNEEPFNDIRNIILKHYNCENL